MSSRGDSGGRIVHKESAKVRSYRATLSLSSSNFFSIFFPLFFSKGRKKQEKQETFPKLANLTEGVMFGRLHIPVFGKKK